MSLSRPLRSALFAAAISMAAVLGACSFQPVYSGRLADAAQMPLAYASPNSRLEQIIYQELAFRLGKTDLPSAPLVSVTAIPSTQASFLSVTANPSAPHEATVTASVVITPRDGAGSQTTTITRTAKAQYTRSGQVLADSTAETEALERAAKAVAESLRLAILAALSR